MTRNKERRKLLSLKIVMYGNKTTRGYQKLMLNTFEYPFLHFNNNAITQLLNALNSAKSKIVLSKVFHKN